MYSKPAIALVYDVWNKSCADVFELLLKQTSLGNNGVTRLIFDPDRPERTARSLSRFELVVAVVGIPGRQDYDDHLHPLLDACHQCIDPCLLTIITHAPEFTQASIDRWQEVFLLREHTARNIVLLDQNHAVKLDNLIPFTERSFLRRQLSRQGMSLSFSLPSNHKLAMMGPVQIVHSLAS